MGDTPANVVGLILQCRNQGRNNTSIVDLPQCFGTVPANGRKLVLQCRNEGGNRRSVTDFTQRTGSTPASVPVLILQLCNVFCDLCLFHMGSPPSEGHALLVLLVKFVAEERIPSFAAGQWGMAAAFVPHDLTLHFDHNRHRRERGDTIQLPPASAGSRPAGS